MSVPNYGVVKGRALQRVLEYHKHSPHYHILLTTGRTQFRIAVSVRSADHRRPDLLYYVDEDFQHPLIDDLRRMRHGFRRLRKEADEPALDYIRGNLFDRKKMRPMPYNVPGRDNDLNEKVDYYVRRAISDPHALIYAFGSRWGPQRNRRDPIFKFTPGNGIHNVHMNQGNSHRYSPDDNGIYQDGALLFHFPSREQWIAIFLAYQSQAWHTDDATGLPLKAGRAAAPETDEPEGRVRIVAATVGRDHDAVAVTLLNTTAEPIDTTGWRLVNRLKQGDRLEGTIEPGEARRIMLSSDGLFHQCSVITLLNTEGLKVDGVAYRPSEGSEGRTIIF